MTKSPYQQREIYPHRLTVFGIDLLSEGAKVKELRELICFAEAAAVAGVAQFIVNAIYELETKTCKVLLHSGITTGHYEDVLKVAAKFLMRFELFDDLGE